MLEIVRWTLDKRRIDNAMKTDIDWWSPEIFDLGNFCQISLKACNWVRFVHKSARDKSWYNESVNVVPWVSQMRSLSHLTTVEWRLEFSKLNFIEDIHSVQKHEGPVGPDNFGWLQISNISNKQKWINVYN